MSVYIVAVIADSEEVAAAHGIVPTMVFSESVVGFVANLTDSQKTALEADPEVIRVEPDVQGAPRISSQSTDAGLWYLDRIDQRNLPINGTYTWGYDGRGVRIYIVDSGIRDTHVAIDRTRLVRGGPYANGVDFQNHGTGVATLAGGTIRGVAKGATVVDVRIANWTAAAWIEACEWLVANHPAGMRGVSNFSWGGEFGETARAATQAVVDAGIPVIGAAENASRPVSPTGIPDSMADCVNVGRTNSSDQTSGAYGSGVDLFAPGVGISVPDSTGNTGYFTGTGTSYASPITAGTVAILLQRFPTMTPAQVSAWLAANATDGALTLHGTGSPNRLLYTAPEAAPTPTTVTPASSDNSISALISYGTGTAYSQAQWDAVRNGTAIRDQLVEVVGDVDRYGGHFSARQSFLQFDTSAIPAGKVVTSAVLRLYVYEHSDPAAWQVRKDDGWTLPLLNSHFRTSAQLAALPLVGEKQVFAVGTIDVPLAGTAITKGGVTRLLLHSPLQLNPTGPTAGEVRTAVRPAGHALQPLLLVTAEGPSLDEWSNPTSFTGITQQTYADSTVEPNTWYRYRVVATDAESLPTGWVVIQAASETVTVTESPDTTAAP
jgi:hypothetical protein